MIVYLLIDGREFTPYEKKWRVFQDKEQCLIEARKLGWGKGGWWNSPLGDLPGHAVHEQGGGRDITMIPVLVEDQP